MATGSFARASLKMTIIMHSRKQKAGAAQPPLLSLCVPCMAYNLVVKVHYGGL